MNYSLSELAARRRVSQKELTIMIRRMKIHQTIYENIREEYETKLRKYQKIDLQYAEKTKLTKYNKSGNKEGVKKFKKKKDSLAEARKLLRNCSQEQITQLIAKLEKNQK